MSFRRRLCWLAAILLLLTATACTPPVQVDQVDMKTAYASLNRSALSGPRLSETTRTVLRRAALLDSLADYPEAVINVLRAEAINTGMPWTYLFALAELNFSEGRRQNSQPMMLAAALYAYAVLFPSGDADRPSPFSPQFQQATSFYNLALTQALAGVGTDRSITLQGGVMPLPFGTITLTTTAPPPRFGGRDLTSFEPTIDLQVRGFRNVYRSNGIGAPMAAALAPPQTPQPTGGLVLPSTLRIPTTAVLTMDAPRRQLTGSTLTGRLHVYLFHDTSEIRIGAQTVPLEFDQTTVRALTAVNGRVWTRELSGLVTNMLPDAKDPYTRDHLYALEPHRPGRIPVVLVHGTASSPFRWADMVNDLLEDPVIRQRYEFWFFTYNTGNPIPISADILRQSLTQAVASLGGVQADPALGRMVVIGHSQGGLLTKMIAIDSGSRIWDAISDQPVESLSIRPETKALLRQALFVTPLPYVETVIFIATPHGGSFQAGLLAVNLFKRLVTLPLTILDAAGDLLANAGDALALTQDRRAFNSINGMTPGNPILSAVRTIPIAPGIHAHSIIPTLQDGPLESRDDGVVQFKSAHLPGVDSELIIERQGHSTQSNPLAVREVRRILLEQLARAPRS